MPGTKWVQLRGEEHSARTAIAMAACRESGSFSRTLLATARVGQAGHEVVHLIHGGHIHDGGQLLLEHIAYADTLPVCFKRRKLIASDDRCLHGTVALVEARDETSPIGRHSRRLVLCLQPFGCFPFRNMEAWRTFEASSGNEGSSRSRTASPCLARTHRSRRRRSWHR